MSFKKILFLITLIYFLNPITAQTKNKINTEKIINVGIAGGEPFVFFESDKGISLDVWEKIANKKSWNYKYTPYKSVDDALFALNNGELDVIIGPISITSKRLEVIRFSQPFYNSSISIMSRIENEHIWQKIKPLFSFKLLMAVAFLLIILAIVGTLFWLAERKKSPEQFSHKPLEGIGTGMWLAIVTMSTTGYGDKAPITLLGRIVAGSWMVISIIFATTMVAGIANTLSISNLENAAFTNIEQLSGKKTATVLGSSSEGFLLKANTKIIATNNLDDAVKKLESKEIDAIVFDRPQLLYYLKESKKENLYISKAEYYKQNYGFAFNVNSQFILDVNLELLKLSENQEIVKIIHNYIQKDE